MTRLIELTGESGRRQMICGPRTTRVHTVKWQKQEVLGGGVHQEPYAGMWVIPALDSGVVVHGAP